MKNSKILPEACYRMDNLSLDQVKAAYFANETVIGFVESISQADRKLYVRLGEEVLATLSFEEATIYPLTNSTNNPGFPFPLQIGCLKEKNICAKVISISGGQIVLSRKENMLEAYEAIKDKENLPFNVTAVRKNMVFGDVGHGVQARIKLVDLCKSRIRSATEMCKIGDSFIVKVLDFDELKRANVSFKDTFPVYDPKNHKSGDVVICTINEPVDNNFSGFFVNVSPQVAGIMDYDTWLPVLQYGDIVECVVSRAREKGLHLKFLSLRSRKS